MTRSPRWCDRRSATSRTTGSGTDGDLTPDLGHVESGNELEEASRSRYGSTTRVRAVSSGRGWTCTSRPPRPRCVVSPPISVERGTLRHWLDRYGTDPQDRWRSSISSGRRTGEPLRRLSPNRLDTYPVRWQCQLLTIACSSFTGGGRQPPRGQRGRKLIMLCVVGLAEPRLRRLRPESGVCRRHRVSADR